MVVGRITRRTVLAGVVGAFALRATETVRGSGSAEVSGLAEVSATPTRVAPPVHRQPGWSEESIGTSVDGRPILRLDSRPANAQRHVVVICGVHGDERAAADLSDAFGRINRPDDLHLTIVPHLNPDGWAAGERRNARSVDLNRNFPWAWPRQPGSGTAPGSEPETEAAMSYLATTRPDLVVWVHQPLNYVAALSGCPPWYADIWSEFSGVPVRRNLSQVGGGESWAGRELGVPSMLVEVGGTREFAMGTSAHAAALEALIFAVHPT